MQDRLAASEHGVRAGVAADKGPPQAAPPADAQQREELYRHADKGIRSFPFQQLSKFAVAEPGAELERPCAETLDRFRDQLPQTVRPGEGKADHRDAAGEDQLSQPRHEELDGMFAVPLCIEHALGSAGGAGCRVGEHAPDLRLGAEQQPRRMVRQILVRRKREKGKIRKRIEMIGQLAVEAAPFFFAHKQGVEFPELQLFNARSGNRRQSVLRKQKSVDPGKTHRYSASPF